MLPSMVSDCPSFIQVTVVAGEPVEIQVRVGDTGSWVNSRCVILGGSGEETPHSLFNFNNPLITKSLYLATSVQNYQVVV